METDTIHTKSPGTFVTLANLGNTCFLNSIIQCLDSIPQFHDTILIENQKSTKDKRKLKKNLKQNEEKSDYLLGRFTIQTVKTMRSQTGRCIIKPDALVKCYRMYLANVLGYINGEIFRQQDAHECINHLLDSVHNTISEKITAKICEDDKPDDTFHSQREYELAEEWVKYINRNGNSGIVHTFFGQTANVIECQNCKHMSWNYQPSWTVHLPIPNDNKLVSIYDCFQKFSEVEMMDGDNKYQCDQTTCNGKFSAKKKEMIGTPPNVLIIHLKRFNNGGMTKNNTIVAFPVSDILDLTGHVLIENNALANYNDSFGNTVKYKLFGVINHYGGLQSGHYTSACRKNNSDQWFYYDDHQMKYINQPDRQLIIPAAYILFYLRVSE